MPLINLIIIIGAIAIFIIVLELVRQRRLRAEYSLLWLFITFTYIVIALLPNSIKFIGKILGMDNPVIAFMFVGLNFLLLVLIQYSTRLSKLTNRYKDLSQQIAIIDHEFSITSADLYNIHKKDKIFLYILAASIAAREKYSQTDIERKVKLIHLIAEEHRLCNKEIEALEFAAIFHDIGKIKIPISALDKTSKLNNEDWEEIKKHPQTSVSILEGIPSLLASIPSIQYHHEHWDGSGYPEGIQGEEIPLGARILNVTDSLIALTSDRPYRNAFSTDKALDILTSGAGKEHDPHIVQLINQNWEQVEKILIDGRSPKIELEVADLLPPDFKSIEIKGNTKQALSLEPSLKMETSND